MPSINANLKDLELLAGIPMKLEALEEYLPLVKGEIKDYDPETGGLKIELNDTNRPDLWCPEGIARQIRTYATGKQGNYPFYDAETAKGMEVRVDGILERIRPFVGAFVARNLEVTEELLVGLIETQEKLSENFGQKRKGIAIGVYNLADIEFPVFYRGVKPDSVKFVPLGFERELDMHQILFMHPKGQEYAWILEGNTHYPLLIDNGGKVLSFPPIINSNDVGQVRTGQCHIFVEATGFLGRHVSLTLNILAAGLHDRGARIEPVTSVFPFETDLGKLVKIPYWRKNRITVSVKRFEKLLGIQLTPGEIMDALNRYGVSAEAEDNGSCIQAMEPPYREDYMHPVDVIEDFAICRGYNTFEPVMPTGFSVGNVKKITQFGDSVREYMVGMGFEEMIFNIISSRNSFRGRMNIPDSEEIIEIANPVSETFSVLRDSLIPGLLRAEAASVKAMYPHRIFEEGEVVIYQSDTNTGSETLHMLAALDAHPVAHFSEVQTYLEQLMFFLNLKYELSEIEHTSFIAGRIAEIRVKGKRAGLIGEIDPQVLENWGIKMPVAVFELNLNSLLKSY